MTLHIRGTCLRAHKNNQIKVMLQLKCLHGSHYLISLITWVYIYFLDLLSCHQNITSFSLTTILFNIYIFFFSQYKNVFLQQLFDHTLSIPLKICYDIWLSQWLSNQIIPSTNCGWDYWLFFSWIDQWLSLENDETVKNDLHSFMRHLQKSPNPQILTLEKVYFCF